MTTERVLVTLKIEDRKEVDLEIPLDMPRKVLVPLLLSWVGGLKFAEQPKLISLRAGRVLGPDDTLRSIDELDGGILLLATNIGDLRSTSTPPAPRKRVETAVRCSNALYLLSLAAHLAAQSVGELWLEALAIFAGIVSTLVLPRRLTRLVWLLVLGAFTTRRDTLVGGTISFGLLWMLLDAHFTALCRCFKAHCLPTWASFCHAACWSGLLFLPIPNPSGFLAGGLIILTIVINLLTLHWLQSSQEGAQTGPETNRKKVGRP